MLSRRLSAITTTTYRRQLAAVPNRVGHRCYYTKSAVPALSSLSLLSSSSYKLPPPPPHRHSSIVSFSSTAYTNDDDETTPTTTKQQPPPSHYEPWMANLQNQPPLPTPRSSNWYTGPPPPLTPGYNPETQTLHSLPLPSLQSPTRQQTLDYFQNTWTLYELLFAGLSLEGFYRPPIHGLRHPQIFYYGHTACLYVNKLRLAGLLTDGGVNESYEKLFEVGVDEMLWDDMHKNDASWPTVEEVRAYRRRVYDVIVGVIEDYPRWEETVDREHPLWVLFMGCEHDRIHLETSSVLFRELPLGLVKRPEGWVGLHPSATTTRDDEAFVPPVEGVDYPSNPMLPVTPPPSGMTLGKPSSHPSFGWDNEYGTRHIPAIPPFSASQYPITNGEYYQFVSSGGYRTRDYWCDDGWSWRSYRNAKWPFFWVSSGPEGSFEFKKLRTIFEEVDMMWDWPVDVNYYEAKAYCRWSSSRRRQNGEEEYYRLLTEVEHHGLRSPRQNLSAARDDRTADPIATRITNSNLNLRYGSSSPVTSHPPQNPSGHCDVTGNSWEWTEDHFNPLENFEVHPTYDDFSTPCFDGKHHMIMGGSFISTGDEASVFARFHFRPHFLQHSGFRLVNSRCRGDEIPATRLQKDGRFGLGVERQPQQQQQQQHLPGTATNVYETDELLDMYYGLHYPTSGTKENVPPILPHANAPHHALHFPQRIARLLHEFQHPFKTPSSSSSEKTTTTRALDIGCAVGGASFALTSYYDSVDAFDYSHQFVRAARRMQQNDEENVVKFRIPLEADIVATVEAAHDPDVTMEMKRRVNFFTGDACDLRQLQDEGRLSEEKYEGVIMSNLLCRLPNPKKCLDELSFIVKDDTGVVVLVTPFSWLENFTTRERWLGGYYDDDEERNNAVWSKETLRQIMEGNGFELIGEREVPLLIREHQRKYQYIVSEATGWRKKKSSSS